MAETIGWLSLTLFLIFAVPLFLRMSVTNDVVFYDVFTRHVLQGGALEKDFVFHVPPGMVWALALIRSVGGWSSEAVRVADLAIVTLIIWMLIAWLRVTGFPKFGLVWVALLLFAFYLSTTEWVHCQPDTWMLLPALVALHLRRRQVTALSNLGSPIPKITRRAFLEGLCWGVACLIKPYVILPGFLAWLTSVLLTGTSKPMRLRLLASDAFGLLAGGLLMGAAWQVWLLQSGSWAAFWNNHIEYRGDFYSGTNPYPLRVFYLFSLLWPWGLLQFIALPLATVLLAGTLRHRGLQRSANAPQFLLAAFYLGWLVQANFVQSQLDYHLVPATFLAMALVLGWLGPRAAARGGVALTPLASLALFAIVALSQGQAFRLHRLRFWPRCWVEQASASLKDELCLYKHQMPGHSTNWTELEQVAAYLKTQDLASGELLCYDATTIPLYLDLGLRPPTRFLYPSVYVSHFLHHREAIRSELAASTAHFIVTDRLDPNIFLTNPGTAGFIKPISVKVETLSDLPDWWPYSEPVVFRAGRYSVHEVCQQRAKE